MTAWAATTAYTSGQYVEPITVPVGGPVAIPNSGLESGASGWNFGGDIALSTTFRYAGTNSIVVNGTGTDYIESTTGGPVAPGKSVTATCMYHQGAASAGTNTGCVTLNWYNQAGTLISRSEGNVITSSNGGWKQSTVTATAPATAVSVKIGAKSVKGASAVHHFDQFAWNLNQVVIAGLQYKCVTAGTSGGTEPAWPQTVGSRVTDGTVVWEAALESSVTWQASALLTSGASEPTWPTVPGLFVSDGTINWLTATYVVGDAKCPQSTVVALAESKVFAGDGEITRFSGTSNPLDWSSERDAGYLPTGLQQFGANEVTALNLYRKNLVVMSSDCFQMWQIDPDPESMALLDQMQGIGTRHQQAMVAVADDLFFLSAQGVRTIGMTAASESLRSGDIGSPVDDLVIASIKAMETAGLKPRATYYTGAGQYWLVGNYTGGVQEVFVYTQTRAGSVGSWSRYTYPWRIDGFTTLGDSLYFRAYNGTSHSLYRVDEAASTDDGQAIAGTVWWPWLDFGTPGQTKRLHAFEVVATGNAVSVSIGYDQTNISAFTAPFTLGPDSMTGMLVPLPVSGPTLSVKLGFTGLWELQQFNLHLASNRRES